MMPIEYVICEYCERFTPLYGRDYASHLRAHHNIEVAENYGVPIYLSKMADSEAEVWHKYYDDWEIYRNRIKRLNDIEENSITVKISWAQVMFGEKLIFIFSNNSFRFGNQDLQLQPVSFAGAQSSLNTIKEEYFNRLYFNEQYKLAFYKGKFQRQLSPDFEKMEQTIELASVYAEFRTAINITPTLIQKLSKHTSEQLLELFKKSVDRSPYLKHLASLHKKNLKLVPLIEVTANRKEECFLFTLITERGKYFIVWENVNENRATHIFLADYKNFNTVRNKVMTFILRDDLNIKRKLLHENDAESLKLKKFLDHKYIIIHKGIYNFESYLNHLLKCN